MSNLVWFKNGEEVRPLPGPHTLVNMRISYRLHSQKFWVIRSGVGPENVHFSEVPRWYWCFESENHWYRPAFEKIWLWREKECAVTSGKSRNDKMIINKMVLGLGIAQTSFINHIPFYLASIVLGYIFLFYQLLLFWAHIVSSMLM